MDNYTLGLDIGITSVGWAAINQNEGKLIDFGVRMFDKAEEAKTARLNRSARRTLRRKKWRKEELLKAFADYGIVNINKENKEITIDGIVKKEYLNFYSKFNGLNVPDSETVYHLRKKALNEKINTRELILCLYNILQARGHFLLENIDFSRTGISFDSFKENVYEVIDSYNLGELKNKKTFEEKILKRIYDNKFKSEDIKKEFKENSYVINEDDELSMQNFCKLLCGYKADINTLLDKNSDEKRSVSIEDIKKEDDRNELEERLVILSDIIQIQKSLTDGCKYICEVDVKHYEEFKKIVEDKDLSKEDKKDKLKDFINSSKSSSKEEKDKKGIYDWYGRSIKNLSHSYPNGMYVNEAVAILKKQSEYNSKITDAFIEVISSIISARIPYYIGPLGKNAKNAWAIKDVNYKYSYDFSKNPESEFESIKRWKERMISHCTYLPEECAMPKGSFVAEVYSILNELNNYQARDIDENDYYLTRLDKIKVFNELFLLKKDVSFKDVMDCLDLSMFGNRKQTMKNFNNSLSLYLNISKIIPEIKLNNIEDLFKEKNKINELEEIILNINLFDEEKSKYLYFKGLGKYTDEQCKLLSKLKSNNFYNVSYKFIMEEEVDINGNTIMEILYNDNKAGQKNNLMVIIQNACDRKGDPKDYSANKYEKIIRENDNKLTYDIIMNKGKTLMPISRDVVRSLNETIKIYNAAINTFGIPNRVIIETASGDDSIRDFTENSGATMKRAKSTKNLYEYLNTQIKEGKNNGILNGKIEEWDEIESRFSSNEKKLELYIRQDGIDLLTGKTIDITNLNNYEIDHILPRGFGDDSMDDKMLTLKLANSKKGDRLPIEFLESPDSRSFSEMTVGHFEDIVNSLFSMKLISEKKKERLLLRNQDEFEDFINQNLVDTRYIIREFRSILNAFNKINNYDVDIVNLKGAFTNVFRKQFGFKKIRNLGDQHHAYDAATICMIDKVLSQYYPNYDKHGGMESYKKFLEMIDKNNNKKDDETSNDRLRNIIVSAFYKAYGQDIRKSSLINQLKKTTPLISWKVEKNYQAKLFDATLYKPEQDDSSVLSILEVNNDKRSFSSVNCIAVDFYKIGGKHYAIHIPYVIVNSNGEIEKDKYLSLVKKHYKADILIGEDGTLQTKAFRFRAYKNDLIYDTYTNEPLRFNIGSIVNKKLDIYYTNDYSYEKIDGNFCSTMMNAIINKYHLKTKQNKDGIEFKELDKKEVIEYLCDDLCIITNKERHIKALVDNTKNINNLKEFCMTLSYLSIQAEKPYNTPKIIGQNAPVVNNNEIIKNKDAEWAKIKYHPLGIRFSKNDLGKLIINGPIYKTNGFKIIKRETFDWKVSEM